MIFGEDSVLKSMANIMRRRTNNLSATRSASAGENCIRQVLLIPDDKHLS